MNILEKLKSTEMLLEAITDAWHYESRAILCHVLKCEPITLVLDAMQALDDSRSSQIDEIVKKRLDRVPLQYCLGYQDFYGLSFKVDENVLIPRPETELLVEFIHHQYDGKSGRLLDIGVGSGAIVVTLAKKLSAFNCIGVDISPEALNMAMENAVLNNVGDRVTFLCSDVFEALSAETYLGSFDVIVSNPPYIPEGEAAHLEPEVAVFEPALALYGGEDGLDFYRRIIPEAKRYLKDEGLLVFEAGHDQCAAIEALFTQAGYESVGHFADYHGIPRFIYGRKAPIGG